MKVYVCFWRTRNSPMDWVMCATAFTSKAKANKYLKQDDFLCLMDCKIEAVNVYD